MKPLLLRAVRSWLLPAGLLGAIVVLDSTQRTLSFNILRTGVLDEPAHLATAALVLLAGANIGRLTPRPVFVVTVLIASMAIDIDHIPLYAGVPHVADAGRPYTHSLVTVMILSAAGMLIRRRKSFFMGAAVGVLTHFLRDIATGPGLQLWWPASPVAIRLPYWCYVCLLVVLTGIATGRALTDRRPLHPSLMGLRS